MIERLLELLRSSKALVKEIETAAKLSHHTLDDLEMSCAEMLFDLAEKVNAIDDVNVGREQVSGAKFVDIIDQRKEIWNGDTDDIASGWDGESFKTIYGKPHIWFWTDEIVACFFIVPVAWIIFSKSNINVEGQNGTDEKKRNLH